MQIQAIDTADLKRDVVTDNVGDVGSLNRVSKCFCVLANPSAPCHDHDQRRWLAKQLRCSQVHRVERTNRLDRKRSADASENRVCDTY